MAKIVDFNWLITEDCSVLYYVCSSNYRPFIVCHTSQRLCRRRYPRLQCVACDCL